MAAVSTQISIDETTKEQAAEFLEGLGLDLSDAINMFLKQVILHDGIPFDVKYPKFRPEVIETMAEAKRISRDPDVKGYTDIEELFKDLDL